MKYHMSQCELYVPRYIGSTINHALVRLTLIHDRPGIDIHKQPLLEMVAELLSEWDILPDKCSITLSITDILTHLVQKNIDLVESWRMDNT